MFFWKNCFKFKPAPRQITGLAALGAILFFNLTLPLLSRQLAPALAFFASLTGGFGLFILLLCGLPVAEVLLTRALSDAYDGDKSCDQNPLKWRDVPVILGLTVLWLAVVSVILQVGWSGLLNLLDYEPELSGSKFLLRTLPQNELRFFLFWLVFGAPFLEEILFRQYLFNGFGGGERPLLGFWTATIVTAAIFAGMHLSIGEFPGLFGLGVFFQLLYRHYHSITACILAHSFNNLLAAVISLALN